MASRTARFSQADLTRAMKAAAAAGMHVGRVEIRPDGTFLLQAASADHADIDDDDLDRRLDAFAGT